VFFPIIDLYFEINNVVRIPIITTIINNSINVKPLSDDDKQGNNV